MKSINIQFGTAAQFGVGTALGGKNGKLFVNSATSKLNLISSTGAIFHLELPSTHEAVAFAAGE